MILVYDARSGRVGAFLDGARKLLMLGGCPLCAITHGVASERSSWRSCKERLGVPVDSFHRDEIPEALVPIVAGRLPCVIAGVEEGYELLPDARVLARCKGSVFDFKGRLLHHATLRGLELPFTRPDARAALGG